jgi:hypothetical protein
MTKKNVVRCIFLISVLNITTFSSHMHHYSLGAYFLLFFLSFFPYAKCFRTCVYVFSIFFILLLIFFNSISKCTNNILVDLSLKVSGNVLLNKDDDLHRFSSACKLIQQFASLSTYEHMHFPFPIPPIRQLFSSKYISRDACTIYDL